MATKRKALEMCVRPAALYACECWALKASDKEKLSVAHWRMERAMVGVSLLQRWRNEDIRRLTKVRDWVKAAEERKCE